MIGELRGLLIARLAQAVHEEPFQPMYRGRLVGHSVQGWPGRLCAYFWSDPQSSYPDVSETWRGFACRAKALALVVGGERAWSPDEGDDAVALARDILRWGGVPGRSVTPAIVAAVFRSALEQRRTGSAPMNSGWSKVAACATAHLDGVCGRNPQAIWDSRVSASVCRRLDLMLTRCGVRDPSGLFPGIGIASGRGGTRPALRHELALRWPYAFSTPKSAWRCQFAGSCLVAEIRDVLNAGYPAMPLPDGTDGRWTMRGVEMVLFGDGY